MKGTSVALEHKKSHRHQKQEREVVVTANIGHIYESYFLWPCESINNGLELGILERGAHRMQEK